MTFSFPTNKHGWVTLLFFTLFHYFLNLGHFVLSTLFLYFLLHGFIWWWLYEWSSSRHQNLTLCTRDMFFLAECMLTKPWIKSSITCKLNMSSNQLVHKLYGHDHMVKYTLVKCGVNMVELMLWAKLKFEIRIINYLSIWLFRGRKI